MILSSKMNFDQDIYATFVVTMALLHCEHSGQYQNGLQYISVGLQLKLVNKVLCHFSTVKGPFTQSDLQ